MKSHRFAVVCAIGLSLSVGGGTASAQPPGPPPVPGGGTYSRPPAFSPYLNLLRAGGSPALNYYGLVRPEMQFRDSIQNLSNSVSQNQQAIGNIMATGNALPATGHPTQFMNLGGYFMNNSGMGGAASPGGMQSTGSRAGGAVGSPPPRRR